MKATWIGCGPPRPRDRIFLFSAILVGATFGASFFFRPLDPLYEMTWTIYSYHFGTVLCAPLVSALAVWVGIRYRNLRTQTRLEAFEGPALVRLWVRLNISIAGGYASGLVAAVVAATLLETPGSPNVRAVASAIPAVAMLWAAAAIGLGIGWHFGNWIAIGALPIVVFGAIVFAYSVQMTLVRVGGATASMVGLQPRSDVMALQTGFFIVVSWTALLLATDRSRPTQVWRLLVIGCLAASAVMLGSLQDTLEPSTVQLGCEGSTVEVCLTAEYEQFRESFSVALATVLDELRLVGAPQPIRFEQAPTTRAFGVGLIPALRRIDSEPLRVVFGSLSNAYTRHCVDPTPDQEESVRSILKWLHFAEIDLAASKPIEMNEQVRTSVEQVQLCT